MRTIEQLIDANDPAIELLRVLVRDAAVPCVLLPPSEERARVLVDLQVTTHSMLGALAYETGGLLVDDGFVRFLGSGHPRFTRTLPEWNRGRTQGFFLVGDDAAGGFFALNGGALGDDLESVHYLGPDSLEWLALGFGFSGLVAAFLDGRMQPVFADLRWPGWRQEVEANGPDRCAHFYPPLWMKEGGIATSSRAFVPVAEAFDGKLDIQRQLGFWG